MDPRILRTVEQLDARQDDLRRIERVLVPQLLGIAASLRCHGFDDYANGVREAAIGASKASRDTRAAIEALTTLTDPRLEQTQPHFPAPSSECTHRKDPPT